MPLNSVRSMHGYNSWANERILEQVGRVTNEEFLCPRDLPWGSIRDQRGSRTRGSPGLVKLGGWLNEW